MARSMLEDLRRLILEQSVKLDTPVANLHGAAQPVARAAVQGATASWLALQVKGTYTLLDEFYTALTHVRDPGRVVLTSTTGAVVLGAPNAVLTTYLLKGAVTLEQPRNVPLVVDVGSPQGTFLVEVDGRTVKQGTNSAELYVQLDRGTHVIEVLATSHVLGVSVPKDLPVTLEADKLAAPQWQAVTTGYLDTAAGTTVVSLSWYVDPRVGGWHVLRQQRTDVGQILAVGSLDVLGDFTVTLQGQQDTAVTRGGNFYAGTALIGTVVRTLYDAANAVTYVTVRLAPDRHQVSSEWVNRMASSGAFTEVKRLARTTSGGVATWDDSGVTAGTEYEYVLQAYGAFDPSTLSPRSDSRLIQAGDDTAPASITFSRGVPVVIGGLARVQFTTPSDADYAGVRVYWRQQVTGTATSATSTTLSDSSAPFNAVAAGWTVRITGGTGQGQERTVESRTTSQLTVDSAWLTVPDATSIYVVYNDTVVCTDYGLPGAQDQFTFAPHDTSASGPTQLYHFRTFDKVGHEQSDATCATWTYTPTASDDGTNYDLVTVQVVPAGTTSTQIQVQVTASDPLGTPQVKWNGAQGATSCLACSAPGGATAGTLVPSGTTWTFARPNPLTAPATVSFTSSLAGGVPDTAYFTIEEQGRDTVFLGAQAKIVTTSLDHVVVRVFAIDPYPQGTNSVTLAYTTTGTGTVTPPAALTITPTTDYSTTGYQDFTVYRPSFGAGAGHFVVTATAAGRVEASDSVVIPEANQDTQTCVCQAKVTAVSTTQVTVTVTAPAVNGAAPQVELVGVTGSATLATGTAAGTYQTQDGTHNVWVFNRGAFQAGQGQAQFRAHIASPVAGHPVNDGDAFVDIPDQGRDTRYEQCTATVTASDKASVTVTVTSAQGGTVKLVSVHNNAAATAGAAVGAAVASGSTWTFPRNAFQAGAGSATFEADTSGYVADQDVVVLPEQGRDTQYDQCTAAVSTSDATSVTVRVTSARGGTVKLIAYNNTAGGPTAGAALGTAVASGSTWTFPRNGFRVGAGSATFEADTTGYVSDQDVIVLPEQGRDTQYDQCQVQQTFEDHQSVSVAVTSARGGTVTWLAPTPTVIVARKSSNYAGTTTTLGEHLKTLGYSVTYNFTADVGTCRAYDVVVIDCGAWGVGEHSAFVQALLDDGQHVLTTGNDTTTSFYPVTASMTASPVGVAVKAGTASPVQDGWTTLPSDADTGDRITGVQAGCTVTLVYSDNANAYAAFWFTSPSGGLCYHDQSMGNLAGYATTDYDRYTKDVFEFLSPQRRLSGPVSGVATAGTGIWSFQRPAFLHGAALVTFQADTSGYVSDQGILVVPEVGRDTVPLLVAASVQSTSPTSVTVRVTVTDPVPLTGSYITLTPSAVGTGTVSPSSAQTVASGGYVDFTVGRPTFGSGTGRVLFTATATGRTDAYDAADIPEQLRDTVPLTMKVTRGTVSGNNITYTVAVTDPYPQGSGYITVAATAAGGASVSPASAVISGAATASMSTTATTSFTVTRSGTPGRVTFTATATNRVLDTDAVDVESIAGGQNGPPSAWLELSSENDTQVVVTLNGALGAGATGHLDYQYRVSTGTTQGAWTTWDTTDVLPQSLTVTRAPKAIKRVQLQVRQPDGQTAISDPFPVNGALVGIDGGTGKMDHGQGFAQGGWSLLATDTNGWLAHDSVTLSTRQGTTLKDLLSRLSDAGHAGTSMQIDGGTVPLFERLADAFVPNGDFDVWHGNTADGWTADYGGGATWVKDTATKYSGAASGKYSNPDTTTNAGWHGLQSGLVLPLRPGRTYRFQVASRCSNASTKTYRLFLYFDGAGTRDSWQQFTYGAANTWQVDEWVVTVPANAEPLSRLIVQFNRNGDTAATDFWLDSIRCIEDAPLASRLNGGKPWVDFSEGIHANKHLGFIPDDPGSNRHAATSTQLTGGDRAAVGFVDAAGTLTGAAKISGVAKPIGDAVQLTNELHPGQNALTNGGFEVESADTATYPLAAGWGVLEGAGYTASIATDLADVKAGTRALYLSANANVSIPANSNIYGAVQAQDNIRVRPGEVWKIACWVNTQQNVPTPAGLTLDVHPFLRVWYSDNSFTDLRAPGYATITGNPFVQLSGQVTIPAPPAGQVVRYARFYIISLVNNTTAGAVSTPNGLVWDVRVDLCECIRVTSLDDEVADGQTHRRTTISEADGGGYAHTGLTSSGRLQTGVEKGADIGGLSAHMISRAQHGVFMESFEELPASWNVRGGSASGESLQQQGEVGGQVYQTTAFIWRAFPANIPYDVTKLYRMRVKVRRTVAGSTSGACYIGLEGVAQDGVALMNASGANSSSSQHYIVLNGFNQANWTDTSWHTYTAWFKGTAATPANPTSGGASTSSPTNPAQMHTGVAYIRPLFIINYNGSPNDTIQIDYIALDVQDETGHVATYSVLDTTNVGRLLSGASDSSGRTVNGMFHKASDTLDDAPDGSVYLRTPQMYGADSAVDNGNFEASSGAFTNAPPGWQQGSGVSGCTYETTAPYSGSQSLKLTTSTNGGYVFSLRRIRVTAGEVWKISAAMKADGGATAQAEIQFKDGAGAYLGHVVVSTTSASWVVTPGTGTVPANAVWAQIKLSCTGIGTVYFDDVVALRVRSAVDEVVRGGGDVTTLGTIVKNLDGNGNATGNLKLDPGVTVKEGTTSFQLFRHHEAITIHGPDTDGVVALIPFQTTYEAPPVVSFQGAQVKTYDPSLGSVAQRLRLQAGNITATTFDVTAQVVALGVTTPQWDDYPSGNALTASGQTTTAALSPGGATGDNYTVNWYVTITAMGDSFLDIVTATLVVALDTAPDSAQPTPTWTERASFSYQVSTDGTTRNATQTWAQQSTTFAVSGLSTSLVSPNNAPAIRLRIKAFSDDLNNQSTFIVRGGDGAGSNPESYHGVTYSTSADSTVSAITDATDQVIFNAQQVS